MGKHSEIQSESSRTRIARWVLNWYPAFRRAGGKIQHISADWTYVRVKLKYRWATRNWVGSVFGGSIYASTDHIYMTQLMQILGKEYVVWDKAAAVDFKKPIRKFALAEFIITPQLIEQVKQEVGENGKYVFDLPVSYQKGEEEYALITKTLYVASQEYYKQRKAAKKG